MSRKNGGIIGPANTPVGGLMTGVAGGVWRMNDVANFVSNSQWPSTPKSIDNSCRFNDGSSDTLTRTVSSAGNRRTFTYSGWIKRSTISTGQGIFGQGAYTSSTGSDHFNIRFESSGTIRIEPSGFDIKTNALFKDVSAWYHIVVAIDTTQSTESNRVKMYINGNQVTSFATATYPSQNADTQVNTTGSTGTVYLGDVYNGTGKFDGYMAEVCFIDGLQLDPTSFGETDSTTGIWKPKKIGQIANAGTNSFYLDFKDSSNLGNDASGLNNDFTVNNLTSIDQATDTCVENFATLNPLEAEENSPTFSDGNLTQTTPNSGGTSGRSTIEIPHTGVWYWEVKIVSTTGTISDNVRLGISTGSSAVEGQNLRYMSNGQSVIPGSASSYGASYAAGDIIGVKVDADNNQVTFYKNGASQGAISYTMVAGETYKAFVGEYSNTIGCVYSMNFGNPPFSISSGNSDPNGYGNFEYSTDSGYALNTSNLNTYG